MTDWCRIWIKTLCMLRTLYFQGKYDCYIFSGSRWARNLTIEYWLVSETPVWSLRVQWVSINSENKFISKWGESLSMKSTAKNVENFVTRYFRFQDRLLEQRMEFLEICTLTYWTISSLAVNDKLTVNFSNFRHVLRTILPQWLTDVEYEQKGICM